MHFHFWQSSPSVCVLCSAHFFPFDEFGREYFFL